MESIIKKVSVKHGEELKGRVLKVFSKKGSFETPNKAPTSTELNAKKNIAFDGPFLNPVFEITQRYTINNVSDLHKKNGVFSRRISEINAHSDTLVNRSLVKFFPQIPREVQLDDKDIRSFIDLQLESNLNIISLPEVKNDANIEDFKKNLEKYWDYSYNINPHAVFMPYLNLSQDPLLFKDKLSILEEYEGILHAIGIKFASIREFRPNLMTLASFSDKDFWIHCSSSKRANWNSNVPTSQIHVLQRYGVDTVSVEIPMGGGQVKNKPALDTRYFNQEKVTIPKVSESIQEGDLICDCPICRSQNFNELTQDLSKYASKQKSINSVLNDFSKIHEVYAATSEFELSRQRIKEGELNNYFRQKEGLKKDLNETYPSQSSLV